MEQKPAKLRELIERGYAFPALLPEKNDFLLSDRGRVYRARIMKGQTEEQKPTLDFLDLTKLDSLDGYTVPVVAHDYGAKTPLMWNTLYERLGLNLRSIMLVADPANTELIVNAFRTDPKYIGGGFGVGFKERGITYLSKTNPRDLASVNIVVKEGSELVGYNTDAKGFVRGLEDKFREIGKSLEGQTFVLLGAGGVAKEVSRLLAQNKGRVVILNRTEQKAIDLANEIASNYGVYSVGVGEAAIGSYLLDKTNPPAAAINLTDKGSDGKLQAYSAFSIADDANESNSRAIARELVKINPQIVVADIVLPKSGKSRTLQIAAEEGLTNLVDGIPMVVNQAAPAYVLVQNANHLVHPKKVDENGALAVFKEAAGFKR